MNQAGFNHAPHLFPLFLSRMGYGKTVLAIALHEVRKERGCFHESRMRKWDDDYDGDGGGDDDNE